MFESKYNLSFEDIKNDLIFIDCLTKDNMNNIVYFGKNTKVILVNGDLKQFEYAKIVLAAKNIFCFMCEFIDYVPKIYKQNTNITYLQDYRIYGKNKNFNSYDYVKKLPFMFYKKSNRYFDNTGMIYMTYVCRKVFPKVIADYHRKSGCTNTILIVPYKLPEYDNIDGVVQVEAPLEDFFNKFDTYIYTPVNRKFDCSPRLVTECFMQGKNVFKDLDYYDIGLETRYNDCINDLESLNLTENDDILKILKI